MAKSSGKVQPALAAVYLKARLGYAAANGKSIYDLVCLALEKDGIPKPAGLSNKQWAIKNVEHIKRKCGATHLGVIPPAKSTAKPKTNKKLAEEIRKHKYSKYTKDLFLFSYEWRKLRMQALKKHGAKCQCCGASPATGAVMNVDHIKPRKTHPELALDINNLQVLCHECNHGKGNWDMTDWRATTV